MSNTNPFLDNTIGSEDEREDDIFLTPRPSGSRTGEGDHRDQTEVTMPETDSIPEINMADMTIRQLVNAGLAKVVSYRKAVITHAGAVTFGATIGAMVTQAAWSSSCSTPSSISDAIAKGISVGSAVYRATQGDASSVVSLALSDDEPSDQGFYPDP